MTAALTPGLYLALRRGAAGMIPADVDAALGWEPDTMATLEARLRTAPNTLMDMLHGIFPFDPVIARRLGEGNAVRVCTGCGCSERDLCWDEAKGGCAWAGPALCTDCRDNGVIG